MTEPLPPEPRAGAGATEPDEEEILRGLYGPPDADGIYRGPDEHPGGDA
ncbi:hypothetical protein JOL79_11225 [Microbispora sp. RL4-1S]|uniref:Uncharacterized protein n=1 Tax=Microbispora oryzae TaxID=2806554 RepID=A0A941AQ62_9ACTN|nr:hypothetical protein [Microbispora oryzae]MBP2704384.1 hypothetical protein [Microbispora oryzae]